MKIRAVLATTTLGLVAMGVAAPPSTGLPRASSRSWHVVSTPDHHNVSFDSVSCTSHTWCMAGGYNTVSTRPVIERWTGADWVTIAAPGLAHLVVPQRLHVSCAGKDACVAVGLSDQNGSDDTAGVWNGHGWRAVPFAQPADNQLDQADTWDVSCATAARCLAVGDYHNHHGKEMAVAQTWDGHEWAVLPTVLPKTARSAEFWGASCPQAGRCVATGHIWLPHNVERPLIEVWTGSRWQRARTPTPSGARLTWLNSVSCVSGTSCVAAGGFLNHDGCWGFSEVLRGSRWHSHKGVVSAASNGTEFDGVSCLTSTSCWAVGVGGIAGGNQFNLTAEHWDGAHWSLGHPVVPTHGSSQLESVSCRPGLRGVGVGITLNPSTGAQASLLERY